MALPLQRLFAARGLAARIVARQRLLVADKVAAVAGRP